MEIILENKQLTNDLNLDWSNRMSVGLIYGVLGAIAVWGWWPRAIVVAGLCLVGLLIINAPVYRFFIKKRGWIFAIAVIPWHWFYYVYSGLAFVIGYLRHWYKLLRSSFRYA